MTKVKLEKESELESTISDNESSALYEQLNVEDLEKAERVQIPQKIDGLKRVTRTAERDPKESITRFDKKTFDPGFMQMHTQEFTYKLLRDELKKTGLISDLVSEVNAGKEATIYIAHLNGAPLIVKAFRHQLTCHNRAKGNPQTRAASIAAREYYRLSRAFQLGLRVPTPAKQINNTIIMSFIGTDWRPAPQLRNVILEDPEEAFDEIIEQMWIMYNKAKLIHGDLSEYNILFHNGLPIFIDFPQAIDMSLREMRFPENLKKSLQVMQKDLKTIGDYFTKEYNIEYDFQRVYQYIIGKDYTKVKEEYSIEEYEEKILLQKMVANRRAEIRDKYANDL
ncbi:MAG: RIO1 family regulatory kinase/ATPase domain-containing protein [Candidatus Heimdallarchaeota archaeon]